MSRRKMTTWTFSAPSQVSPWYQGAAGKFVKINRWQIWVTPSCITFFLPVHSVTLHGSGGASTWTASSPNQPRLFFPRRGVSGHASRCMNHSRDSKSVVLIGWVARLEWGPSRVGYQFVCRRCHLSVRRAVHRTPTSCYALQPINCYCTAHSSFPCSLAPRGRCAAVSHAHTHASVFQVDVGFNNGRWIGFVIQELWTREHLLPHKPGSRVSPTRL